MPRITKTPWSPDFALRNIERERAGDNDCCTIQCVAVLTGQKYEVVAKMFTDFGRRHKKAGTLEVMRQAFKKLGHKVDDKTYGYHHLNKIISQYPKPHNNLRFITTHHPRRFPEVWRDMPPMALFTGSYRHVAAFKDGTIHDWSINNSLRVCDIWIIEKEKK